MEFSVVIPVYNSAATLPLLVQRLCLALDSFCQPYEIIFVEDGSVDNSWEVLSDLQKRNPRRIVAVQLMRNYGQHNALMCGFRHSCGKYVITMDDDLQNPPEEIPKLLKAIETENVDLLYGCYESKKHSRGRNMGSVVVSFFYRTVYKSSVTPTAFRVIRRSLLQSIFSYDLNFTYVDGLLAWNTQRIGKVVVEHHRRTIGNSGYSLSKLLLLAFNLFTNFSLLPLQLASAVGFCAAILGFLTGTYYLFQYLFANIAVPGYASTIIAILVLGGTQLLALGIMGEYLGRLHLNVNRKPQYVERQVLAPEASPAQGVTEKSRRDNPNRVQDTVA
jgi:undecaprenyl-phosphate 4-deoxy-4-formamido-L-arabinose transferase